jgi:heme exporter protein CcmD
MNEFFAMGGYANFVWASWGVSAICLVALTVFTLLERRAAVADLRQLEDDAA